MGLPAEAAKPAPQPKKKKPGPWRGDKWEFPKIGGTLLGVPIIRTGLRTIVCLGFYWGPPILGNYQMERPHLEGQGDSVSRLITVITYIVTRIIPIITLFTESL